MQDLVCVCSYHNHPVHYPSNPQEVIPREAILREVIPRETVRVVLTVAWVPRPPPTFVTAASD